MKSNSLWKSLVARWQLEQYCKLGKTRPGTNNTVASQGSNHLLVKIKIVLELQSSGSILPGLVLACWL